MIPLTVGAIAAAVGGRVAGDPDVRVSGPVVMDSRRVEAGSLFVAFPGAHTDGHLHVPQARSAGAVAVLGTRPTELPTIIVPDPGAGLQRLAASVVAGLRTRLTVLAVTGSQGKTSTKDLTAAVLTRTAPTIATAGNLNNGLGVPLTMLRATEQTRMLVLEMGARHVGDIAALTALVAPDVATVLNVGRAHIGEFGSVAAIAEGKGELVAGLRPGGTAVLNADDPLVAAMSSRAPGPIVTFGHASGADVQVRDVTLDRLARPSFTLHSGGESAHVTVPFVGAHQASNAAAAVAAAMTTGVTLAAAAHALADAAASGQRMQLRTLASGATLIDDSYNSSPGSVRSSLDALAAIEGRRRIAVLGEILELGDESAREHREAGRYAAQRADIVIGVGGPHMRPLVEGAGAAASLLSDRAAVLDWLRENVRDGDAILIKASRGVHLDEVADALT